MDRRTGLLWAWVTLHGLVYAAIVGNPLKVSYAFFASVAVGIAGLCLYLRPDRTFFRFAFAVALSVTIATHYASTGAVIRHLGLSIQDTTLIQWDRFFLGWLFPDGQFTLWMDQHAWFNPATWIGKLLTEVFQFMYFSYYWWGYGLLAFLMFRHVRKGDDQSWRDAQSFMCAWIGAYLVNYAMYVVVPVIGPQFIYKAVYQHPLEGFGLAGRIRDFILANQANPTDCFPSGHTALSWVTALMALKLAPRYGRITLAAAILITLSTVFLRYHYVTDLVAAIPLVLLGLHWGDYFRLKSRQPASYTLRHGFTSLFLGRGQQKQASN